MGRVCWTDDIDTYPRPKTFCIYGVTVNDIIWSCNVKGVLLSVIFAKNGESDFADSTLAGEISKD